MTLCIGAQALEGSRHCIILCCDSKVSNEAFASETETKAYRLSFHTVALTADRPARAKELARLYETYLLGAEVTQMNFLEKLREPIGVLKERIARAYVERKLGVAYRDFLQHGIEWFGQATVDKYRSDIERNPLGVEMVIAGFINKMPFLCELRKGEVNQVTNFSLIGSGAYTAEPALHARNQTPSTSLTEALYNVYEAKRLGESSPFVGTVTKLFVLRPGQSEVDIQIMTPDGLRFLDKQFRKYGPKPLDVLPDLPANAFKKALGS